MNHSSSITRKFVVAVQSILFCLILSSGVFADDQENGEPPLLTLEVKEETSVGILTTSQLTQLSVAELNSHLSDNLAQLRECEYIYKMTIINKTRFEASSAAAEYLYGRLWVDAAQKYVSFSSVEAKKCIQSCRLNILALKAEILRRLNAPGAIESAPGEKDKLKKLKENALAAQREMQEANAISSGLKKLSEKKRVEGQPLTSEEKKIVAAAAKVFEEYADKLRKQEDANNPKAGDRSKE